MNLITSYHAATVSYLFSDFISFILISLNEEMEKESQVEEANIPDWFIRLYQSIILEYIEITTKKGEYHIQPACI